MSGGLSDVLIQYMELDLHNDNLVGVLLIY